MKVNFYISCETDEEMQECLAFMKRMTDKREGKTPVKKAFPFTGIGTLTDSVKEDDEEPMKPGTRANVDPGPSAITKIGSSTKEDLMVILQSGMQPKATFIEHLKLLWHRGEVKFDGKDWYL